MCFYRYFVSLSQVRYEYPYQKSNGDNGLHCRHCSCAAVVTNQNLAAALNLLRIAVPWHSVPIPGGGRILYFLGRA